MSVKGQTELKSQKMDIEEREKRGKEDFSFLYKTYIVLLWWKEIQNGDWDLNEKGYVVKHRNRILCICIGIVLYTIIILLAVFV